MKINWAKVGGYTAMAVAGLVMSLCIFGIGKMAYETHMLSKKALAEINIKVVYAEDARKLADSKRNDRLDNLLYAVKRSAMKGGRSATERYDNKEEAEFDAYRMRERGFTTELSPDFGPGYYLTITW